MRKISIFNFVFVFFVLIFEAKAAELPLCDDVRVAEIVSEQFADIKKSNNVNSPINARILELAERYIKVMKEIDIENFKPEEEFAISDKIMELKVNRYQTLNDMRLCKGTNEKAKNKTYMLLYNNGDKTMAFVITLLSDQRKEAEKIIEN